MSRSLKVSPQYIEQVKIAVKRNGFPRQRNLAKELQLSLATVSSFLNGRPVDYLNFYEICQKLGLDLQKIADFDSFIVIFIDEVDSVLSLNLSTDDFFTLIRGCYNQRVNNPEYKRLTFGLLRVATPSDFIQDKKRTPFNIGKAVEVFGIELVEAQPLTVGLTDKVSNPQAVLKEVLRWSGAFAKTPG